MEQHTHSSAQSIQEQQRIEGQLRVELNEAVELAERQNALTVALEAKVRASVCELRWMLSCDSLHRIFVARLAQRDISMIDLDGFMLF